jgi:hypothetical protein
VEIAYNYFPRVDYGPGPWTEEPDHLQFEACGLPCLVVRHPDFGHWCAYAGVPPGHPLHGVDRHSELVAGAPAHFSLNYSAACDGWLVCHLARPGEAEPVWWFGMDFGHAFDLSPGPEYRLSQILAEPEPGVLPEELISIGSSAREFLRELPPSRF